VEFSHGITGGAACSLRLRQGHASRLESRGASANASMLIYAAADPPERLNVPDTLRRWPPVVSAGPGRVRRGPSRLTRDRYPGRIAAEGRDVPLHPLERGDLVKQPPVAGAVPEVEEALGAEPVVDGDARDPVAGEGGTAVAGG
jgi:hypothetical protein